MGQHCLGKTGPSFQIDTKRFQSMYLERFELHYFMYFVCCLCYFQYQLFCFMWTSFGMSESLKCKELASSVSLKADRSKLKTQGGDIYVVCSGPATDFDILECVWCEGLQHRSYTEISVEKYSALSNLPSNVFSVHIVLTNCPVP